MNITKYLWIRFSFCGTLRDLHDRHTSALLHTIHFSNMSHEFVFRSLWFCDFHIPLRIRQFLISFDFTYFDILWWEWRWDCNILMISQEQCWTFCILFWKKTGRQGRPADPPPLLSPLRVSRPLKKFSINVPRANDIKLTYNAGRQVDSVSYVDSLLWGNARRFGRRNLGWHLVRGSLSFYASLCILLVYVCSWRL